MAEREKSLISLTTRSIHTSRGNIEFFKKGICTKRLLVRIRSSLLANIIFRFTKYYNCLPAYLHSTHTYLKATKVIKNTCTHNYTDTMPSSLKLGFS